MLTQKLSLDDFKYFKPGERVPSEFVPLLEDSYLHQHAEGIRTLLEFAFQAHLIPEAQRCNSMPRLMKRMLDEFRANRSLDPDYFSLLELARKTADVQAFRTLLDVIVSNPSVSYPSSLDIC